MATEQPSFVQLNFSDGLMAQIMNDLRADQIAYQQRQFRQAMSFTASAVRRMSAQRDWQTLKFELHLGA